MSLAAENKPKYATVLNGSVGVLGTGASTVGATALTADGIAADAKAIYTAGAYGGIVESITLVTDDTAAVQARLYILDGATVKPLGSISIPLRSGDTAAAVAVDGMATIPSLPLNSVYKKYIPLKANCVLKLAVSVAMTANKYLIGTTTGVDFIA
jgi:hypothetical protein